MQQKVTAQVGATPISIETGKIARLADGAVVITCGDTMVLASGGSATNIKEGQDYFPLTVDYREKAAAVGKFPGGYFKREGRPSEKETLTSRMTDRPLRPLFPAGYLYDTQIISILLSADGQNDPDILAINGASAALSVSDIPFAGPIGAVRVGRVNGQFIANPTHSERQQSDLDLVYVGMENEVIMIEGAANEIPEADFVKALEFAHGHAREMIRIQKELAAQVGKKKREMPLLNVKPELLEIAYQVAGDKIEGALYTSGKVARAKAIEALREEVKTSILEKHPETDAFSISQAFDHVQKKAFRISILDKKKRVDGRGYQDLRPITCEVGVLPRTHGSAVFQRGETQALVTTTLGTVSDEQRVDGIMEEYSKKFMLDYNFPPFSVGECRPIRGPGRREIGHGALAERSLKAVIPSVDKFPYTIRVVSDILESNGSSSMASVCGGTLSLMDAGVPLTAPVAGISIGLVKEGGKFVLLTDIMGDEDHYGDMDFKVAGTVRGITGIQLDLKIDGINDEIIRATLDQARDARREILRQMLGTLRQPRNTISTYAPRLLTIRIDPQKIGLLIGPGGKTIKGIQEATGAKIDIEDDGTVFISHMEAAGAEAARSKVEALTEEVRIGKVYTGRVTSVKDFGAFIEILPGRDGLCHISELDDKYVDRVDSVCKVGDKLMVKVIAIDDQDRVKLSRKAVLREQNRPPQGPGEGPPPRRHGDSGPRRRPEGPGDNPDAGRR